MSQSDPAFPPTLRLLGSPWSSASRRGSGSQAPRGSGRDGGPPETGTDRPPGLEDQIALAHVRKVYAEAAAPIAAHIATGIAVAMLLWPTLNPSKQALLIAWLLLIAGASGLRAYSLFLFRRSPTQIEDWRTWARTGVLFALVFGVVWAVAILAFFDIGNPTSVVMLTVVPIAIASAATATNASLPAAFYAIEGPITIAVVVATGSSGTALGSTIAVLMLITAWLRVRICQHVHAVLDSSLRLGFENLALRREAERANAAKSRFLAAASHDLRQPVHALGLAFSALTARSDLQRSAPLVRQVERCIGAVEQMLQALLDISKLDAGVVRPVRAATDLAVLLGQLEQELGTIAARSGNRLRMRPCASPLVYTDAAMLEGILRNLIGNALRYTRNGTVLVCARRRQAGIRIEVRDNGIGIDKAHWSEIFLEFRQLGDPQRDRRQGLGLGLAIVKRQAAVLGHPLGLRSEPGRGSCFWIALPKASEADLDPPSAAVPAAAAGAVESGRRVLVLDDDPDVCTAMLALLTAWGYVVSTAATIAEALRLAGHQVFDVMIIDYRLSDGATGVDVIAALREQRGGRLPMLLVTGDTDPERLRQARDLGLPCLHKPVKPAQLRAVLKHLVGQAGNGG